MTLEQLNGDCINTELILTSVITTNIYVFI